MKCRECPDYAKCVKESNLKIKRKSCKKAKTEYVMTNADRIRSMTDEELAELIVVKVKDIHHQGMRELAYSAWLKWLQQPAEGDDHA